MKKILLILLTFNILCTTAWAQQEPLHTQFMYNKLAYNPGYAGNVESPTLSIVNRHQWVGIEGAPNTQGISFTRPFLSNRFGLGLNLVRQQISINRSITAEVSYAYRIALPKGELGVGMQFNLRHFRQDWTDPRIVTSQPVGDDGAIPGDVRSRVLINFGTGLFYSAPTWYVGVAAPRLIPNSIDLSDVQDGEISREYQHFNMMSGMTFKISDGVELTPQVLLRYVKDAPADADINVTAAFQRKFYTGLTYRVGGDTKNLGESIDMMAGMQATKNLFFLLSYDFSLTRLRKFTAGSFEATVRWYFNPPEGDVIETPRGNF